MQCLSWAQHSGMFEGVLLRYRLRTHACTEPYIIATNRQLSRLHPVFALLHPHFKFTMPINRNARQKLISAGGVIETTFSPGQYAMRISSAIYDKIWEFDKEALPADLIRRWAASRNKLSEAGFRAQGKPFASDSPPATFSTNKASSWGFLLGEPAGLVLHGNTPAYSVLLHCNATHL